jgi:hypothetical protein
MHVYDFSAPKLSPSAICKIEQEWSEYDHFVSRPVVRIGHTIPKRLGKGHMLLKEFLQVLLEDRRGRHQRHQPFGIMRDKPSPLFYETEVRPLR